MDACSVLVVDDDPSIRVTVAEFLAMEGHPVETARNGAEALLVLGRDGPTILLLDMRMPVLDGWGVARDALREQGREMPTLVMTAAQDAGRWAQEIGAAGWVGKPIDLDEVLTEVERVCAAAQRRPA